MAWMAALQDQELEDRLVASWVTIHRLRAPGLTWYRLPLFIWSIYATSVILVLATPVLAITLVLIAV